jgi:hypothetical protein
MPMSFQQGHKHPLKLYSCIGLLFDMFQHFCVEVIPRATGMDTEKRTL